MSGLFKCLTWGLAVLASIGIAASSNGATFAFAGSDSDLDIFPGGSPPYVVVPWRSETKVKEFDVDGNNVYGSAGYALFATQFNWPNQGCCGSGVPFDSATYPNLIELPDFVAGTQNLVNNKVGGWGYALVDDPELVNGFRDFNWGDTQDPPVDPPHSQSPYVKIGILDGNDIFGNDPQTAALGAGRWGFEIGPGAPPHIRVGVMTDGLDANRWAATEVILAEVSGTTVVDSVSTGQLTRNRFVDIHTFDIMNAEEGDQFAIFAKASSDGFGAISGVTFDVVPEPSSVMLGTVALMLYGITAVRFRNRTK